MTEVKLKMVDDALKKFLVYTNFLYIPSKKTNKKAVFWLKKRVLLELSNDHYVFIVLNNNNNFIKSYQSI